MEMQIEDNDNSMIIDDEIYQEEMEWDIWKSFEIEFILNWFCITMHLPIVFSNQNAQAHYMHRSQDKFL